MIAIAAMDSTGGIGKTGSLPWDKDKMDMALFRHMTVGGTVIMGRKTWEDPAMPKPLKGRLNVVISQSGLSHTDYPPETVKNTIFYPEFDVNMFMNHFRHPVLIGGASLYNKAIRESLIRLFVINVREGDYGCDTKIDLDALNKNYMKDFPFEYENAGEVLIAQRYLRRN